LVREGVRANLLAGVTPSEAAIVDAAAAARGAGAVRCPMREELVREGVRGCELGSLSRHFTAGTRRPTPNEGSAAAGSGPFAPIRAREGIKASPTPRRRSDLWPTPDLE
jgi:hypothetical protein